jgi:hypothetical protein
MFCPSILCAYQWQNPRESKIACSQLYSGITTVKDENVNKSPMFAYNICYLILIQSIGDSYLDFGKSPITQMAQ